MRAVLAGAALVLGVSAAAPCAFAEIQYAKIIEASGSARIYRPPAAPQALTVPFALKKGQKIVTPEKTEVEIAFNEDFSAVAHLTERSRLGVMSEKSFLFFLEHGGLFLLREDGNVQRSMPVTVVTPELQVEIEQGGCWIDVSKRGTRVKVFGDQVKVSRLTRRNGTAKSARRVDEGFQVFATTADSERNWHVSRLVYTDYDPWQSWVKKAYERKDDWEADQ